MSSRTPGQQWSVGGSMLLQLRLGGELPRRQTFQGLEVRSSSFILSWGELLPHVFCNPGKRAPSHQDFIYENIV